MRTILDLDSEDGSPYRLLDILTGDEDVSDDDKNEMGTIFYGVMTNKIDYLELVDFFQKKLYHKYILESKHPEILEMVTIPGEVLDKTIETE